MSSPSPGQAGEAHDLDHRPGVELGQQARRVPWCTPHRGRTDVGNDDHSLTGQRRQVGLVRGSAPVGRRGGGEAEVPGQLVDTLLPLEQEDPGLVLPARPGGRAARGRAGRRSATRHRSSGAAGTPCAGPGGRTATQATGGHRRRRRASWRWACRGVPPGRQRRPRPSDRIAVPPCRYGEALAIAVDGWREQGGHLQPNPRDDRRGRALMGVAMDQHAAAIIARRDGEVVPVATVPRAARLPGAGPGRAARSRLDRGLRPGCGRDRWSSCTPFLV